MKKIMLALSIVTVLASCSLFHKEKCCKGEHKNCTEEKCKDHKDCAKDGKTCPMHGGANPEVTATPTPDATPTPAPTTPAPVKTKKASKKK